MKISKKTREQAALICAIAASSKTGILNAAHDIDADLESERLAVKARERVDDRVCAFDTRYPVVCAEAEALLRTGWCPNVQSGR